MTLSHSPRIVTDGLVFSFDPANKKCYSPNLVLFPTYDSSDWKNVFSSYATVTTGINAPDGSNNAVRFSLSNTGTALFRVEIPSFVASGTDEYSISFYVRKISGSGTSRTDLHDEGNFDYSSELVQGQWVRIEKTLIPTNKTISFIDLLSNINNDLVLDFWGVQVEKSSSATSFNPNYYNQSKTIYNLVNNSQTGTLATIQECSSDNIRSLMFDGANDYITLDGSTFDFSTGQTINLIFKKGTGAHSARRNPYNQAYGGYGTITSETDGDFSYYHGTNGGNGTPYDGFRTITPITENELVMLTLTRDVNNVAWYINGELDVTEATVYPNTVSTTNTILIGEGYAGPPFLGEINYVGLYNRGLSATEVKQNFNALRGRYGI